MATALDIIKPAMRRIGVLAKGEEPDAADAADALEALNRLLVGYEARGCGVVDAPLGGLSASLTLADKYHLSLIDVLALYLAPDFGVGVSASLDRDAAAADRTILKAFVTRGTFGADTALLPSRMSGNWLTR